jgi:hypothetical protein
MHLDYLGWDGGEAAPDPAPDAGVRFTRRAAPVWLAALALWVLYQHRSDARAALGSAAQLVLGLAILAALPAGLWLTLDRARDRYREAARLGRLTAVHTYDVAAALAWGAAGAVALAGLASGRPGWPRAAAGVLALPGALLAVAAFRERPRTGAARRGRAWRAALGAAAALAGGFLAVAPAAVGRAADARGGAVLLLLVATAAAATDPRARAT